MIAKFLNSFACGMASALGVITTFGVGGYICKNEEKFKKIFKTIRTELSKTEKEEE